jgi:hypothetical protein
MSTPAATKSGYPRMSKPDTLTKREVDRFANLLAKKDHAPFFIANCMICTAASAAIKSRGLALIKAIKETLTGVAELIAEHEAELRRSSLQ